MTTPEQRRDLIAAETAEFLQYRASNQTRQFLALLDAIIADHLADLVTIRAERLTYVQGAVRQLQALREVMVSGNLQRSIKA